MNPYYLRNSDFGIGTRVRILRHYKYRSMSLVGKFGTVRSNYGSQLRVKVDDMTNPSAPSGDFYFKPSELEIVTVGELFNDYMEEKNMPNITNYLNAVKIKFVDNASPCNYIYANFNSDVGVGDLVVVKPAHHNLTLARVVEVIDQNDFETPREVVAKVDTEAYDNRVANRVKAVELKAKMQERAKQLQDIALYQMLAKNDPAMLELLNEYQALPKM